MPCLHLLQAWVMVFCVLDGWIKRCQFRHTITGIEYQTILDAVRNDHEVCDDPCLLRRYDSQLEPQEFYKLCQGLPIVTVEATRLDLTVEPLDIPLRHVGQQPVTL